MSGSTAVSARLRELLAALTTEEKVALLSGSDAWHTTPVPRLGIGRVKVSDGPTGVRGDGVSGATAVCFPVGTALGATFDTGLVAEVGSALAAEARTKDVHVVLGPTVNLQRHPLTGRHFECYSEDPVLTARLAVAFIDGVQSGGVGACIKHYVANDQEHQRHTISAEVAERPLRELYLYPFERAVAEADPWMVMAAYNRVGGVHATEHRRLLTDILRTGWGYRGTVVSDWGAITDGVAAVNAGCDLEMPGPARRYGRTLLEAAEDGRVPGDVLDERVLAVLRLAERAGRIGDLTEAPERSVEDPAHRTLARRAATLATVLVRNEGVLPLDPAGLRRVAVVGPNAADPQIQGGGSSVVRPHRVTGPVEGIRAALGDTVEVVVERGCRIDKYAPAVDPARWGEGRPVQVELFAGETPEGDPVAVRDVRRVGHTFYGAAHPDLEPGAAVAMRWTATFTPAGTGDHTFGLMATGRSRMFVDDRLVIDNWSDPRPGDAWFGRGSAEERAAVPMTAGEPRRIVVELSFPGGDPMGGLQLGCIEPEPTDAFDRAVAAATDADAAVVVVGTNPDWETEGHDRTWFGLPGRQVELIRAVAAVNPRTVVVVNAGSPVDVSWLGEVPACLWVWFGGQEMGHALADVLFGAADPGGRLPCTFPRRLEDTPAFTSYPGELGEVHYGEGVFIGHRWYDARGIEPAVPFGHGLSYATWEYRSVAVDGDSAVVEVVNVGDRPGTEVVQVYAGNDASEVLRPPWVLAGFARIHAGPGEAVTVRVPLERAAFAHWDHTLGRWVDEAGTHRVAAGRSSRDLRVHTTVRRP